MERWVFRWLLAAMFLGSMVVSAADAPDVKTGGDEVSIDLADPAVADNLGFGWSRAERGRSGRFRWITSLEADVRMEVGTSPSPREVTIDAAPFYLPWRQQIVGVYVNRRFVDEFLCVATNAYRDYTVTVPAAYWVAGTNLLTLRMGYRESVGGDTRDFALAVRRIKIRSLER